MATKMNIEQARELLKGMNKLEVSTRNDPKVGKYQVLINTVELATSRKFVPYISANATVLVPVADGAGKVPGDDGYAGHLKGDTISFAFFFGDRFNRDFSPFLCAALDFDASEAAKLSGDEVQELAMSVLKCEGQPVGVLDGTTVIEMRGVESPPTKNKAGELKTYINLRFDRHVALSSLAEHLDEKDIEKFFGSEDRFMELVAEEETEG